MTEPSEYFIDYINGDITPENEQEMFSALSIDDELRSEFRCYMAINNTMKKSANSIMPSNVVTNNIFSALGFKFPAEPSLPIPAIDKVPFYKTFLFNGLITGIVTTAATVVIMLTFFMPKDNTNLDIIPTKTGSIKQVEKIIHSKIVTTVQVDNNIQSKSNAMKRIENNIQPEIGAIKQVKPFKNSNIINNEDIAEQNNEILVNNINDNLIAFNSHIFNNMGANCVTKNLVKTTNIPVYENLPKVEIEHKNTKSKPIDMSFEAKGMTNWNLPKETIAPSNLGTFNNTGLFFYYDLADNFSIGGEIRQETFFVEYTGTENDGKNYRYEQHPCLTSYGLDFKYQFNNIYEFKPYTQLIFGYNKAGFLLRPAAGLTYNLLPNIYLSFGIEYSHFWYQHQNSIFNASKVGINYGVGFKL